jgi:Alcohol dehydrogenase, class IV
VAFGAGAASTAGDVAKELGFKRVLIVTDENVEKIGHSQKVIDSLTAAGMETFLFADCEMDAPDYTVQAGADLVKTHAIDGIVGIGGGRFSIPLKESAPWVPIMSVFQNCWIQPET